MCATQGLRLHPWSAVSTLFHWGLGGIHRHTATRQSGAELLRSRQLRESLWSWPIWLLHMLLRSCQWPAHQLFPKPFLLICLPLMRILKAKYFLSLPFLQLTVTVTSCGLGGVTRRLEGGFCVRFSSLIRAERIKCPPFVAPGRVFSAQYYSARMSHMLGASAPPPPSLAAAVQSLGHRWREERTDFCKSSTDFQMHVPPPQHPRSVMAF